MNLPTPLPASNDCLPHAAMNLGSAQGLGIRPAALVSRLVIEEQYGSFVLYRLDATGGFVGDTWHGSIEDAAWQVKKEFGITLPLAASRIENADSPTDSTNLQSTNAASRSTNATSRSTNATSQSTNATSQSTNATSRSNIGGSRDDRATSGSDPAPSREPFSPATRPHESPERTPGDA